MERGYTSVLICFALALLGLTGCSSVSRNLDDKLANETQVKSRADLATESKDLIENAKDLTPAQKEALLSLRKTVGKQLAEIRQDSVKLRSVLIRDALSAKPNQNEIDEIEQRLSKLDNKQTSLIFGAVDVAERILGREPALSHQQLIEDMMMINEQHPHEL